MSATPPSISIDLEPIRDVDHSDYLLLSESGRYLALWMSYEDAIRVADLKIRRARFDRVYEARVAPGQLLQIREFLHPRVQEIADILPSGLGRLLIGNKILNHSFGRFTRHGRILNTTSISGFLQLYILASLRPLRRKSLRFEREQNKMADWLRAIPALAREDYALALEVAECPRLVKGYGDTHLLGTRNFDAVMAILPSLRGKAYAAARVKQFREAALADDTGEKLSDALREVVG